MRTVNGLGQHNARIYLVKALLALVEPLEDEISIKLTETLKNWLMQHD